MSTEAFCDSCRVSVLLRVCRMVSPQYACKQIVGVLHTYNYWSRQGKTRMSMGHRPAQIMPVDFMGKYKPELGSVSCQEHGPRSSEHRHGITKEKRLD
ncbi:hypothetical protein GCM10028795_24060 [Lysobacter olei]